MSRFFRGGSSSSESDSDSDYSSSDEERRHKAADASESEESDSDESSSESDSDSDDGGKAGGPNKFLRGFAGGDSEDESDEDVKRVVKSARDKRFDEMRNTVNALKNAKKINDWVAIQTEFDKLNKAYSKAQAIINREGIPRFYIRTMIDLEEFSKEAAANKAAVKKMNASSARSLNTMKTKLKKHNKAFEADVEKFKAKPVDTDASADEAEAAALAKAAAEESDDDFDAPRAAGRDLSDDDDFEVAGSKRGKKGGKKDDGFQTVGKGGKVAELKPEDLFKKLREMIEARGKKGTDRTTQMQQFDSLLNIAATPYGKIKVLLALIPARFDVSSSSFAYLPIDVWKSAADELNQLFGLLEENSNIHLVKLVGEEEEEAASEIKFKNGEDVSIRGSLASLIDRIDDEFIKSLQHIDPHTSEYVARLRDETILYALIVRAQKYLERAESDTVDHIKMRRLEHLYYKPDIVIQAVEKEVRNLYPALTEALEDPVTLVEHLCTSLYKTSIDRVRTRSLLCHVYHLALHDNYERARDLMLMSHLQDHVQQTEVSTQILFNRTMVQIGMCAFRSGMVKETANALQEFMASGRVKELLAQGVQMQRFSDKTPEQEKLEKQRQLPFHMHINLELLECIYLTCSMLLEIPNMAANAHEPRRKVISKPFRRMLDYSERQVFNGPPENTRDHIMAAAKALAAGEWQRCRDLIHAIKIWDLMPNSTSIKEMLTGKIQEEGLRTYFFTYAPYYDSLGIEQLGSMFDLPPTQVRATVSRMIINEELHASIDQPTESVILHRSEMSRLEYLAGVYSDKVASLVESNEKLLESRATTLGLATQERDVRGGHQGHSRGDRQGFRGGRGGHGRGGFGGDRGKGRRGQGQGQRAGR
ncbi:eukaryotic translation initiation factor 3 subunit 8 N-terminus-domain-containing protein [Gaertneriomyces semiglobifer]|nr:eukaryotic translation initiation factor 3 subunit 8 N-terminus-domain-containing protein [Gaertneriomyces semiglobifer]